MLKLKNISKTFNGLEVIKNLSCEVARDDFVVVMGPNGAGKSTLFDLISGKTIPDGGSVEIEGRDITGLSERKRTGLIGRLFQNTHLGSCSHLTVEENLALANLKGRRAGLGFGLKRFPEEIVEQRLKPLNLNLEKLLNVPLGALSGGQRQMIAFFLATLHPPKILLLDEPTAALDPDSAAELLSYARDYAKEHRIATLLITHDPWVAKHMGNRLWVLRKGAIREYGLEKREMDPQEFFSPIDYAKLADGESRRSHDDLKEPFLCCT